jgi:hypothetical protein
MSVPESPPTSTTVHAAAVPKRARRPPRGPGGGSILLVVLLVAAYFIPRGPMWNADSRIFLTASIVDRGQLNIDPFASDTGDVARYHGHAYSDKAPGMSLLAVPVYALLKYTLLDGRPYTALFAVPENQRIDFLPRYLLALVFAGLPTGLLSALLYAFLARLGLTRAWRTLLALTYGLGTIALPFADVFFGHQLAAALLFGAFVLLFRVRHGELAPRYNVLAGALAGSAVITEYPTAIIAGALLLYALGRPRAGWRRALLVAAGAAPALALAAVYNTLAFGGPLGTGYAHLAGPEAFRAGQAQGFMGITYPHLDAIWQTTFGPYRGLFLLSPVLLLAIPGFVLLARDRAWRAEVALWLGIVVAYFGFVVSYFEWDGGFSLGPRHFLPALPFLVLPIGELLRPGRAPAWRGAVATLSAVSIAIVGLATATDPLIDPRFDSPLTEWVLPALAGISPDPTRPAPTAGALAAAFARGGPLLTQAQLNNNWGMVLGLPGGLQLVPLLAVVGLTLAWRSWRGRVAGRALATASVTGAAMTAVPGATVEGQRATDGSAAHAAAPQADAGGQRQGEPAGGSVAASGGGSSIPVRQVPGPLARAAPQGRVAIKAPGDIAPWEERILDAARQHGDDEPPLRVRQALTAVKLALAQSQSLSFFRRIRSILLYGPLARGDDPFGEADLLIVCHPLKGTPIEQAFGELDRFARNVRAETGVELRYLLVVRGQPERAAPGEPSWRELAQRGVIVYGEPID